MTSADQQYRYCHECGSELWSTVVRCPGCGAATVSYPPEAVVESPAPDERAPVEVIEFDLSSLSDTERRSLGPRLELAGIAHVWRDAVWLQVGAHRADDAGEIIDRLPPADDPVDPSARQSELLGKLVGTQSEQPAPPLGHMGTATLLTMTMDWLRSKFHRRG